MKRILPVLLLTVSLVSSLAFSVFSAPVFSTGELPLPLVNPVTQWFETNEPVHFGNMSGAGIGEGVYVTPSIIYNNFSDVYMGDDAYNDDGYISAGYYSGNYVTVSSSDSNGWTNGTNFQGGPNLYATCSEVRTMQPGAVIEFYVHVGNVQLKKQLSGDIVSFNRITGVRLGLGVSSSGDGFTPVPAGEITYEIITYQDKNLYADSQQNLRRLVQKVKITNVSTHGVYFSGIQLIFGISTENGLGMADPNITPYGYVQYRFELSISPVLTYNVTSRNEAYLDSIGGTIGTFDDKFDSMNGSLGNLDNILDNWNNATWEGISIPDDYNSIKDLEAEGLSNARPILSQMLNQLGGDELVASTNFWQTLFLMLTNNLTPIAFLCAIASGLLIVRALMGR